MSEDPGDGDAPEAPTDGASGDLGDEGQIASVAPEELRAEVEAAYDFDAFGPAEMDRMSADEWEAVFDPDAWVTGAELIARVHDDLSNRVAGGQLFAAVERRTIDGEPCVVAYAERDYAVVHPDGSVSGRGTVLRDVKPAVALCSMPEYDVPDPPSGDALPTPSAIDAAGSELGNRMLQVIAGVFLVAGVALLGAVVVADLGNAVVIAVTAGGGFVLFSVFLLVTVANARLSGRYRAAEYKERLAGIQAIRDGDAPFPTEGAAAAGPIDEGIDTGEMTGESGANDTEPNGRDHG